VISPLSTELFFFAAIPFVKGSFEGLSARHLGFRSFCLHAFLNRTPIGDLETFSFLPLKLILGARLPVFFPTSLLMVTLFGLSLSASALPLLVHPPRFPSPPKRPDLFSFRPSPFVLSVRLLSFVFPRATPFCKKSFFFFSDTPVVSPPVQQDFWVGLPTFLHSPI